MGFADLLAEGVAAPVEGWDFSWFDGRATEERPPWGYATLLADRAGRAHSALDIETGGGEVFDWALSHASDKPRLIAATESWPPNSLLAHRRLVKHGGGVVRAADQGTLPFRGELFDLVSTRHPVVTVWGEVARALKTGGHFLSQQIGPGSNRELYEFLMGPQPPNTRREASYAVAEAETAGLEIVDLRSAALEVAFFDVAAVVHFLRKVIWTVPDFTVEKYRDRLEDMHRQIERDGRFVCHAQRFLIEARKP